VREEGRTGRRKEGRKKERKEGREEERKQSEKSLCQYNIVSTPVLESKKVLHSINKRLLTHFLFIFVIFSSLLS
jgi:hypothetical protein